MQDQPLDSLFEPFKSPRELNRAINLLPDAILILDNKGRVFAWNKAMEKLTGVKATKIIGKKNNVYSIPFYDTFGSYLNSSNKNAEIFSGEGNIILADKKEHILWANARKIYDKNNNLVGAVEIIRDITKFKELEKQLSSSEEKYETLAEKNNDGMIIIQDNGTIKYANPAICELTGYKLEKVINKNFLDYIIPSNKKIVMARYQKSLLGYKTLNKYEIGILTKSKKEIIVETNTSRIVYDGKPAMMTVLRNITKRKILEQKLKESEERFKIIFDNTQDGLLLVDTSNRKICMCNKAICKMLGYTKKELLSSKIDRLHLNKNMPLIIDDFSHKEDGQKETNFNIAIRRKDGKVFYADINDTCLKINDIKYIMANFRKTTKN